MPITIACPGCSTRYSLPDATAGKTAKCKKCDQVFRVPVPRQTGNAGSESSPNTERPGLADRDDDIPPQAPPRPSTSHRPVPPPVAAPAEFRHEDAPPEPPRRFIKAANMPPEPSRRAAEPALDDFGAHEVLDDFPEVEADLPPSPAWSMQKPKGSRSKNSGQGILGKLQGAPLPALIFVGGSAALWLFLLTVVVPSMAGQGAAADAAQAVVAVPAPVPAQAVVAVPNVPGAAATGLPNPSTLAQTNPPMPGGAPSGFGGPGNPTPGGLPAAMEGFYAAGTNPASLPKPPIRQDLITRHMQVLRGGLKAVNDLTAILRTISDVNTFQQAGPRVQQVIQTQATSFAQQLPTLPPLSAAEDREMARQLVNEALATNQGFKAEVERLQRIPALSANAAQMSIGLAKMTSGFNELVTVANQPEPGPIPYIEVLMNDVPDGETNAAILEMVIKTVSGSGGQMSLWNRGSVSTFRIWPVADPAAFAAKAFPAPARVEVRGYQIFVTGHQPDPAQVAAIKVKRAEEEKARAIANAPDPSVAPGTPPIDAALIKLKSGKNHLVQQAAQELARVVPEDARKAEVTKALIPLVASSDNGSAKEAINALGNWKAQEGEAAIQHILTATTDGGVREASIKSLLAFDTPESLKVLAQFMLETTDGFKSKDVLTALIKKGTPSVVPYLIQYLEKSQDGFGRAEAIKALGRMKAVEAAPAIVARIKDNLFEVPDALRALGPEAEPAVIPLLKNSDSQIRKLACEVLRDIGGQETLDVMKKLPADPDVFVKQEAANAMQAIKARLKSQKPDSAPAKEGENPFGNRPVKARG